MKYIHSLLAVLILSLAVISPAAAVQLRYNMPKGAAYSYDAVFEAGGTAGIPIMGQVQKMEATCSGKLGLTLKVKDITARDTYLLDMVLDGLQMSLTVMGEKKDLPPDAVPDLKGKAIAVEMDRYGKIIKADLPSLKGVDGLVDVSKMIAEISPSFPQGDVKAGEAWETASSVKMPQGGEVKMVIRNVYKGTVEVDGKSYHQVDSTVTQPGGAMNMTNIVPGGAGIAGSCSTQTTSLLETDSLLPFSAKSLGNMKLTVKLSETDSFDIDMQIKTNLAGRRKAGAPI